MTRTKRTPDTTQTNVRSFSALTGLFALSCLVLLALTTPTPATANHPETKTEEDNQSYGFVRRVEGDVRLAGLEGDEGVAAEVNHPLLTGDTISTESGRAEIFLPNGSVIRVDRSTSVVFEAIAGSPDTPESEPTDLTLLILDEGAVQIRASSYGQGDSADELAVRTPNSTVYLAAPGEYRVSAQGSSFTEVVVRQGFAEAETRAGSAVAREDDALEISGYGRPFVDVVAAGPANGLELWAGDLDRAAANYRNDELDPRLGYAAAPLEDNGEWVVVEKRRAWRPYVRADWQPFRHGRWVYTPSGLTWVASAPWGWVTSHYGVWDYVPGYGWLWLPGNVYMPAGVYWYWGPTYVGWIPSGYYNRYYGFGYSGVYGWAGGPWGYWSDWTFCPTRYFGRPAYDRYWRTGRDLGRDRRTAVPRGIVTTDTRGLTPDRWGKPNELHEVLVRGRGRRAGADLADVTDIIARREVGREQLRALSAERTAIERERLRPLSSDTARLRRSVAPIDGRTSTRGITGRSRPIESGSAVSSGTKIRRVTQPGDSRRSAPVDRESSATARERVRSLAGSEVQGSSRPIGSGEKATDSPGRRVVERIRSHRGGSTDAGSARSRSPERSRATSKTPNRPQSRSTGISRGSGRSSSGSSARGSSSGRSSTSRSSPPSSVRSGGSRSIQSRSRPNG